VQLRFHRAGHILGAGFLEFVQERRGLDPVRIVFSGALGRPGVPRLKDPDPLPETDTVVIEATYGDRLHEVTDVKEQLRIALAEGFARGGVVLIPAFAVGRTQEILYHLNSLYQEGALPQGAVTSTRRWRTRWSSSTASTRASTTWRCRSSTRPMAARS
jgi:metallo-beta-lactamase family protein